MTPAARMIAILAMLQDAEPEHLLPSETLWAACPDYRDGDLVVGRRQFRRDVAALAARGLIQTGISSERTPRRSGVQLLFVGKPTDWELTADEHAALRRARERHGRPAVPTTVGRDSHGRDLDLAMDAVRILEEAGEWMLLPDVAAELGQQPSHVLRALRELLSVDANDDNVYRGLLTLDDFDEDTYEDLPLEQVRLSAERNPTSARRPLFGYGLTALGRFAYTARETDDRLALIEQELADPASDSNVDALHRAQTKLEHWKGRLAILSAERAMEAS